MHVYISCMRATCPANIILLYHTALKYLARVLNYEAAGYYNVFILGTFSFFKLSCSQTSRSVCPSCAVNNGVCRTKGFFLVGDFIIFVVERRSATLAEF
jgi:hypothetical protein